MFKTIVFVFCVFVNVAVAFETKVIVRVGDQTITNVDVFKEKAKSQMWVDRYANARVMEGELQRLIEPHLFEQYTEKHKILVTDQQVMDSYEEIARKKGYATVGEYLQRGKNRGDKGEDFKNWDRFKTSRRRMQQRRSILHFDPDILVVTEADIQEFVEDYRKRYYPPTFGDRETVQSRRIFVWTKELSGNKSLRKELEKIKKRLNEGVEIDDIAREYADRKDFHIDKEPVWQLTNELIRDGLDELAPWATLKGKAIIVLWRAASGSPAVVMQITGHRPSTRIEVGDAVNDKEFRKEVIKGAKGLKYQKAKRKFLEKAKSETVVFVDDEEKVYQKLADDYELWWAETYKDSPDFQQRLEKLQASKTKYLELQKKKKERRIKKGRRQKGEVVESR